MIVSLVGQAELADGVAAGQLFQRGCPKEIPLL